MSIFLQKVVGLAQAARLIDRYSLPSFGQFEQRVFEVDVGHGKAKAARCDGLRSIPRFPFSLGISPAV